jgi:hypothetical protein
MKAKQTAVEWFQEQIIKIVNGTCELSESQIFLKAKAMHKEEIMKSNRAGIDMVIDKEKYCNFKDEFFYVTGEEYYNKTYGCQDE